MIDAGSKASRGKRQVDFAATRSNQNSGESAHSKISKYRRAQCERDSRTGAYYSPFRTLLVEHPGGLSLLLPSPTGVLIQLREQAGRCSRRHDTALDNVGIGQLPAIQILISVVIGPQRRTL